MDFVEVPSDSETDLYPSTEKDHTVMLARCERLFTAARTARQSFEDRWARYYKLSQSHVEPITDKSDWGSRVFVPLIFATIETIKPRLVAQLPVPIVSPVGPEDESGAREMETLLGWATEQSGFYMELVECFDSALRYGTGIIKVTAGKKAHTRKVSQDVTEPIMAERPVVDPSTGQPLRDPTGQITMEPYDTGQTSVSGSQMVPQETISYIGPVGECIDIFNFFPDPMATCMEDATYVIQRSYKPKSWVKARVKNGFFRVPPEFSEADFETAMEEPAQKRLSSVDLGGTLTEMDRVEVRECWYDDGTVVTSLNGRMIVRVVENPFDHGELPFHRVIDHMNAHEFWGVGEVQHLEGPQDLINAMTNQRVDNVRLLMESVFYGDARALKDRRNLKIYPGSFIPVETDGQPLDSVFKRLDMGDVTASSYNEVDFWKGICEQVSGVSPYTSGTDVGATSNSTATGVALISEQGNTRFTMKLKMAELTGLRSVYRQYGALIQQFMPEDFIIRITGEGGVNVFKPVDEAALYGSFDYAVEADSSAQTETVRKQTAMDMFNTALAAQIPDPATGALVPVFNISKMGEDLVRSMGKKDIAGYMYVPPPPPPAPDPSMMPPGQDPSMMGQDPNAPQDPNAALSPGFQNGPPQTPGSPGMGNMMQGAPQQQMDPQMLAQMLAQQNGQGP